MARQFHDSGLLMRLILQIAKELLDVGASTKAFARAGDHDHVHLWISHHELQRVCHFLVHARVHRIALFRPRQRKPRGLTCALQRDGAVVVHWHQLILGLPASATPAWSRWVKRKPPN